MNNAPTTHRLTHREVAAALGINFFEMAKLRSKGSRLFDPTFPAQANGLYSEVEVLAWKKSKEGRSASAIDDRPRNLSRDRRQIPDRRNP